jgi:hypothetical protein
LDDGLELRGMFGRKLGTITDTEDPLARVVPEQEGAVRDLRLRGGMLTMSRRISPFAMRSAWYAI